MRVAVADATRQGRRSPGRIPPLGLGQGVPSPHPTDKREVLMPTLELDWLKDLPTPLPIAPVESQGPRWWEIIRLTDPDPVDVSTPC